MKCLVVRVDTVTRFLIAALLLMCLLVVSAAGQAQPEEASSQPTTGTITGRVVTESGHPLPNATVSLRGSQALFQPRTTTTDSEGNFQISGLDPLLYGVSAIAPAYVNPPRDPDSPPNYYRIGDSITVDLIKGGVITGTVQSATGEPIVQIMVRAVMVRDGNGQAPRYQAYQMQRVTDDRGIYRIYGLLPGTYVVSTMTRGVFVGSNDPYDTDAATYAPSSTRDTAAEISVRAGEETSGVDIRYRGEPGRVVSGVITGFDQASNIVSNVNLTQISNGVRMSSGFAFQPPGRTGFAFYGVSDGDYELMAQASPQGEVSVSEPRRITVKGANVSGIELSVRPLGSIRGRVALEKSDAPECKNKRQPLFSETLVVARRNEKATRPDEPRLMMFFAAQGSPTKAGEFQLRNLAPGQYNLGARFFARYWYLRSISKEAPLAPASAANKTGTGKRQIDLARDGLFIKFGERPENVTFVLTEGAGSLRGKVNVGSGESIPGKLYVHLVPVEKENTENVLRFFAVEVKSDGTFSLNNLPPGRYWTFARVASQDESHLETAVRTPEGKELRTRLSKLAEAVKTELDFKPCQNVTNYSLPYR
ncbi:MAG TPA: carboxypeptidase regulatory-like domain-containing protein [Pyrinomonadaceae bacterium]|nr:carboxypeptidase regulatory-like domain-containing protein [Pyrinomonadaceae bacterium]